MCILLSLHPIYNIFLFFFNDTATTEIYTLSLHDALPILKRGSFLTTRIRPAMRRTEVFGRAIRAPHIFAQSIADRKSTRLNSSHANISYAVFCLKKKKKYPR